MSYLEKLKLIINTIDDNEFKRKIYGIFPRSALRSITLDDNKQYYVELLPNDKRLIFIYKDLQDQLKSSQKDTTIKDPAIIEQVCLRVLYKIEDEAHAALGRMMRRKQERQFAKSIGLEFVLNQKFLTEDELNIKDILE